MGLDATPAFLSAGGVAGETARAVDWARTPLGPVHTWPRSLQTTVGTVLRSRHPMFLWWGPELIQFYNDGYLPSFGVGRHPAALGQRGRDCWPEIWPIIGPQIDAVMTRGEPSWNEDALVPIWRNGRIEEVYWTYGYSPVFDDDGGIGGTLVVCTETTARVLQGERLSRMRRLVEAPAGATALSAMLPAGMAVLAGATNDIPFALAFGEDGRLVSHFGVREEALEALAARLRGADGLVELAPFHGLAAAPWPEPVQQAYVAHLGSAGASIAFGLSPRLPFDDVARDHLRQVAAQFVSARQRLLAIHRSAQLESERRDLLLQAPVATALLTGPDHVFTLANERYSRIVGRPDLVGKTYRQAFPELAGTELPGILDRVFQTGEPYSSGEVAVRLQRGGALEECFFTFNLQPTRDAEGRIFGMMAVAVDISSQVFARRALEKAHHERERLLAELEAASTAKDQFLAMLGHELRNPLAPIFTALHLMKLRAGGTLQKERTVIERQVAHLTRLVDDLLDVSRITRGKVELKKERVELAEVVAKAIELSSPLLEQRQHHLALSVPARGLLIDADVTRLAQVISNLLTNAAKYTPPGGHIEVAAVPRDGRVALSVRDDGMGIAPAMLPRVFELFAQERQEIDRSMGGLGLGLAIAKSLVDMHDGALRASSGGHGEGSVFTVELPRAAPGHKAVQDAEPPTRAAQDRAARRRVLVVDDNDDAAELLAEFLRASGHHAEVAHDGPEALLIAGRFRPEIALLDIGLPVMDGYELARRLRSELGPVRLIALTGYGQASDRETARQAGFDAHLVKPVDLDALAATLD